MPEGPEVTILAQLLSTKLQGRTLVRMEILSGKYVKKPMKGYQLLTNAYTIKGVDSKGKLLWMALERGDGEVVYLMSHLGLTGFWSFSENRNDRIRLTVRNEDNTKEYYVYFEDDRNFGNVEVIADEGEFRKKVDQLAPDSLKSDYSVDDFVAWWDLFLSKSKRRAGQNIALVLMKQKKADGIVSGIGNYLMAEILYECRIDPHREVGSLSKGEIERLGAAVQYVTKLSYYNNETGYMTHFEDFILLHKERVDKGIYPNYHPQIKLKAGEKFEFKVYRQKFDPKGNEVAKDRDIQGTRTTYWVPAVQR